MTDMQVSYAQTLENLRHNKSSEAISRFNAEEVKRNNIASLMETSKHNRATEGQAKKELQEQKRHSKVTEGQTNKQLKETHRSNIANEKIGNKNASTNRMNAKTNQRNARTNEKNARTNQQNARINAANAQTNARNATTNARNASVAYLRYGLDRDVQKSLARSKRISANADAALKSEQINSEKSKRRKIRQDVLESKTRALLNKAKSKDIPRQGKLDAWKAETDANLRNRKNNIDSNKVFAGLAGSYLNALTNAGSKAAGLLAMK